MPIPAQTERWCAGLRAEGRQSLGSPDRLRILQDSQAARRRIARNALVLTSLGLLGEYGLDRLAVGAPVGVAALAAFVGFLALLLAQIRWIRNLSRDLRDGEFELFRGSPTPEEAGLGLSRRWLGRTPWLLGTGRPQSLHRLPHSGLVLRVNGLDVPPMTRARTVELAAAQPHAFGTPLPPEVLRVEHDSELVVDRRSLSREEREELGLHARHYRRRFWIGIAASAILSAQLGPWTASALDAAPAFGWCLAAVTFTGGWWLVRATYLAVSRRIEADRARRWVVRICSDTRPGFSAPSRMEILPSAELLWSERDRPARWRHSGR
jgi:hypothetical protein